MSRPVVMLLVVAITPFAVLALTALVGRAPRTGANLSRAGLMELQNLLEPERKVEIVREMENKEALLVTLDDKGET
jgi:hypothetical protein